MGDTIQLEHDGPFTAYTAAPPEGTPVRGALVVIQEVWGLVAHIEDVADRFAAEGYLVVAPDLIGRAGITTRLGEQLQAEMFSPDAEVRSAAQPKLREAMAPVNAPEFADWAVGALTTCVDRLLAEPAAAAAGVSTAGVVGFCFGGSYAFALAAADERVTAAVPFYGTPPDTAAVGATTGRVLAFYGEQDERVNASLPELEAAMTAAGVDFTHHTYPGVGHAFFNDTNPVTYDADTAADAWRRTLAFLAGA
jgi:carboxymethylenebutenolidase